MPHHLQRMSEYAEIVISSSYYVVMQDGFHQQARLAVSLKSCRSLLFVIFELRGLSGHVCGVKV